MATTAKSKLVHEHMHQILAYAQNAGIPSLERLVREIAAELELKVDEDEIKRRRLP